jgi:hypothetical protein
MLNVNPPQLNVNHTPNFAQKRPSALQLKKNTLKENMVGHESVLNPYNVVNERGEEGKQAAGASGDKEILDCGPIQQSYSVNEDELAD